MQKLLWPGKRVQAVDGPNFTAVMEDHLVAVTQRADAAYRTADLAASYPTGLTITGVASSGSITVSAHTRRYPSGDKTLQAGSVASVAYGTVFYVYYDDSPREGGLVTYYATTTRTDAAASIDNPNRHFVGKVTTPAGGGSSNTTGTNAYPPGHT